MEEIKIFTSLKGSFYRKKMVQGMLIALLGLGIIFFLGPLVKPPLGFFILLLGVFLIAFGLIPLRRLSRLDQNPDELIVSGDQMHYIAGGKPVFSVPVKNISDLHYVEEANRWGIALTLRDQQDIIVHDPHFKPSARFFLPYFERRSFSRIGFLK
jgi:hypothetical protein